MCDGLNVGASESQVGLVYYPHEDGGRQLGAKDEGKHIKVSLYSNELLEYRHDYDLIEIEGVLAAADQGHIVVFSSIDKEWHTISVKRIHCYSFFHPQEE